MKKSILYLAFVFSVCSLRAQIVPIYNWAGKVGGTSSEYGDFITTDASGNVYLTGRFDGTCDFDPGSGTANKVSAGSSDIYIAKYTQNGNLIWVITMGGTGLDRGYGMDIDANGNIYLAGTFSLSVDLNPGAGIALHTSLGGTDMFVAKYDSSGNYIWSKAFGEINTEFAEAIALDGNGFFYLTGEYSSDSLDLDPGSGTATIINANPTTSYDPYLAKYDTSGNFIWGFGLQGTSSDYSKSVTVDANGNAIIGGYFFTTMNCDPVGGTAVTAVGSADCFIASYDSAGTFNWAKSFGGTLADNLFSVTAKGSDVYSTGTFNSIVDFDPGVDTLNIQSKGSTDVFIHKLNNAGELQWAGGIGGTGADNSNCIRLNAAGDLFIAGSFMDSADFDISAATATLKTVDGRDGFLAKYDNSGAYKWALKNGSALTDYTRSVAINSNANSIWVTGYFGASPLFVDPQNVVPPLTSSGANDIFIAKYSECSFPVITAQPSNSGTCPLGNATYTVNFTGTNLTFQWQEGTNGGTIWNNINNGNEYSGATTQTLVLTGVSTAFNNRFYRCVATESCGLNLTSGVGILFVSAVDTTVNINQHILTAAANAATYQWLDCNNGLAPIPGATAQQFIPTLPGTYALSVTKNGCNDTSACYTITTIGLNDITASDVRIFPVPARDEVTIILNVQGEYTAAIYDLTGRNMLTDDIRFGKSISIPVNNLETGAYLLGIRKNEGEVNYFRIVKQ